MARTRAWVVVLVVVLVVGAYNQAEPDRDRAAEPAADSPGSTASDAWTRLLDTIATATGPAGTATSRTTACAGNSGPYSGLPGCEPGGEAVTVDRVVDGDTLRLTDGREIQLIGVDAPEVGDCAGDDATHHARTRVEGQEVTLHDEPGVGTDRSGRRLGYIRYAGPDTDYDLGYSLVYNGLAAPYPAYAGNSRYTANILDAAGQRPAAAGTCEQAPTPDEPAEDVVRERPAPLPAVPQYRPPAGPSASAAAYYPNCDAARAAGAAPLSRDEPGYRPELDRDDDGVACEV